MTQEQSERSEGHSLSEEDGGMVRVRTWKKRRAMVTHSLERAG
jgi:hypothetical protein